jgi:hypothetical protein
MASMGGASSMEYLTRRRSYTAGKVRCLLNKRLQLQLCPRSTATISDRRSEQKQDSQLCL